MSAMLFARFERHRRLVGLALLLGSVSLFARSVVRWHATAGLDPDLRPLGSVYFFAAVTLMVAESVYRPARTAYGIGILLVSILLLILGSLSPS